jgi:uncharacterized protein DUF1629
MTCVFELRQDDSFQALVQVDHTGEIAYESSVAIQATRLCGQSFGTDFKPIILSWGASRKKRNSDIHTMLSPFLVFSAIAFEALLSFLDGKGDLMSVIAPVEGVRGFHVTQVVEGAVDMDASKFKIYPTATIFKEIVLLEKKVQGIDIFRLREKPAAIFVSERFKEAVLSNKLKGANFGKIIPLSSEF